MSEARGYFQAARGGDPDQLTCRECGAMLHSSATTTHTSWHDQLVTEEKLIEVIGKMTPRG